MKTNKGINIEREKNSFENELDEEIKNQIRMGLNDKTQYEIMQKISFTNELLNQLKHFKTDKILMMKVLMLRKIIMSNEYPFQ